jgi:topoisomerase-4 subunit A
MRYTEARLTQIGDMLLTGLDEDTVDFRPTYDGEEQEPVVLPGAFPNLLANGAAGIAVGMATSIPPHNAGEICDALLHLIKHPNARIETLVERMPGPDFPTGGVLVEPGESILDAYKTGRGGFRLRARWEKEDAGRGQYRVIVTEVPYQVQKAKLVERIAALLSEKKLPLLADVRDESAETVRLVLEPRSRTVEAEMLMEHLFRQTDLEQRFPLNMNVLDAQGVPRVMDLREVLRAFLEHRQEVLVRRSKFRQARIEQRLEVLDGFLIVYLNLDKVIRIIREQDEPKPALMKAFKLTDNQAEAILNMRLRSLRKLEEMEIRREKTALEAERKQLAALLKDEDKRWAAIAAELAEVKKRFGSGPLGKRRTLIADAPKVAEIAEEAFIEREPITVLCSEKGWIRAMRGHIEPGDDVKYKEGDRGKFWLKAETTDKLVLFGTNGRFYTLACDKLPGGRGLGEPVRLMIDLGNDQDIVQLLVRQPGRKLLVASTDGRGFVVPEDEVIAQTKNGKQVLNVAPPVEARVCTPVEGDSVACLGENRKLLLFPLAELPEMTRGRGITLQKYREGGLADAKVFTRAEGLSWKLGDRVRVETDLKDWFGERAQAGRLPPKGFPRGNRFG